MARFEFNVKMEVEIDDYFIEVEELNVGDMIQHTVGDVLNGSDLSWMDITDIEQKEE